MFLAERISRLRPSQTAAAAARAKALQDQGRDIIVLTTGEPDFDTPPHVVEAACDAIKRGQTRYTATNGTVELRRAICRKFTRDNGLVVTPEQVVVSTGAKQAIFNALVATIEAGDEVIVPAPYWVSYPDIVLTMGGIPRYVACSAMRGYKLDPEALRATITPRTKWLVLNSPCNPSGAVYTADELRALGSVVRESPHVHVMSDDVYEHLLLDDVRHATFAQVNPDLADRTLTINAVSKSHAMTGWRIGFASGPTKLLEAMASLQSQSTTSPSSVSQAAALAALNGPMDFLAAWNAEYRRRRDFLVGQLSRVQGLTCPSPAGAFYAYPSCEGMIARTTPEGGVIDSDAAFANYLLEFAGVAVVPGVAFGTSPAIRISFAASMEKLRDAAGRIASACARLS
jgi:aspartate aminotransferase